MSQTYVKTHTGAHAQSGLTATISVVSATAGNHFRLNARVSSNGRSVVSVSDGSNTWHDTTEAPTDAGSNNKQVMWYAENVASGSYTVTLTWDSASATNVECWIDEFSGTATSGSLDQHVSNGASVGASPLSTGTTSATTSANENVYTAAHSVNGANARPLTNPPSGYTADESNTVNSNASQFCSAHKNVTSTGTQTASWAWTGGNSAMMAILATFVDAVSSPTGTATVALKPGITASGTVTETGTATVALKPGLTASGTVTSTTVTGTASVALGPRITTTATNLGTFKLHITINALALAGFGVVGIAPNVAFTPGITSSGTMTDPSTGAVTLLLGVSGTGTVSGVTVVAPNHGGGYPSTKVWPFTSHRTGPKVVTHFEDGKPVQPQAPTVVAPAAPSAPVPKRPVRRKRVDLSPPRIVLPPLVPVVPPHPLTGLLGQDLPPVQVPRAPKPPAPPTPTPPPPPKKVVLVTRYWGGLGLAMLAQRQGSDLIVATDYRTVPSKERKATEQIGHGLVPRLPLEQVETLVKGDNVLWVFDSNDLPKEADRLRAQGELVIGTSALSEQLEDDREFAADFAKSVGFDLPVTEQFHDYQQAVKYLEAHPDQAFVFKPDAQDPTATYVPLEKDDPAKANEELREYLNSVSSSNPSFILQEVVNGVEANFECWVSGGVPLVGFCDLESKRKLVQDLGENLGCAGDYVFRLGLDSPALAETVLRYLSRPELRDYTGSVDANVMLKDGKVYFLENCFRFGYNAYGTIFQELATGSLEDTLRAWATGDDLQHAFKPGFGSSLTLVCDHPKDGTPILLPKEIEEHLYLYRGWCDRDHCAMVEEWPEVAAVTAYGDTMTEAGEQCLELAKDVTFPGKGYRVDLASEELETLPIPRYKALQDMGWVEKSADEVEIEELTRMLEVL